MAGTRFEDLNLVTVTGKYGLIDGTDAQGKVTFTPTPIIVSHASHRRVFPVPISVTLTAGTFSIDLPATDDPDFQPTGWTYQVTENITGASPVSYNISVPVATSGVLQLADVAPVQASGGTVPPTTYTLTAADSTVVLTTTSGGQSIRVPSGQFDAAGAAATAQANAISAAASTALQRANNLGDLANPAAARTALGLGTAATQPSSAFDAAGAASSAQALSLQKASNLSDVANAATARANLGLGSMATVTPTGTASSSTVLYGDNVYRTPSGGSSFTWTATKTAAYTAASGDAVPANPSGGTFAVTAPTSPGANNQFRVANITTGTNTVSVVCGSSFTDVLQPSECQDYSYTGSTWVRV